MTSRETIQLGLVAGSEISIEDVEKNGLKRLLGIGGLLKVYDVDHQRIYYRVMGDDEYDRYIAWRVQIGELQIEDVKRGPAVTTDETPVGV